MNGLNKLQIALNRKILADMAVRNPKAFAEIAGKAKIGAFGLALPFEQGGPGARQSDIEFALTAGNIQSLSLRQQREFLSGRVGTRAPRPGLSP